MLFIYYAGSPPPPHADRTRGDGNRLARRRARAFDPVGSFASVEGFAVALRHGGGEAPRADGEAHRVGAEAGGSRALGDGRGADRGAGSREARAYAGADIAHRAGMPYLLRLADADHGRVPEGLARGRA